MALCHGKSIGGMFEVESSRLALQNSQNNDVKHFARKMIYDHTKANDQLEETISSHNTDSTQPTVALDPEHQKLLDKLNKKTGTDFDKLYIKDQVKAHKDAVKLFSDYATNGDDEALRQFAAQTLPTLKQHKQYVARLQRNYKTGE